MNVRFYILTILLMSSLLASSAKEVNSVSYMDFTDGANEVEEYAYDANGNMTEDLNRGIESITYDWNNMPREITFTSGAKTRYTYDAAGRKLRAEYITPLAASANYALGPTPPIVPPLTLYDFSTVDYHGDCVLRNDSLERVLTPNGYITSDTLHYYIKDYQGNVRSIVRQDGAVVESNEYYPYGGLFAATASAQPYKYNAQPLARRSGRCNVGCKPVATAKTTFGNELDRTHGLDLYDSEARWYDSLLGRTSTMDPKAEKYYSISPYAWCAGNPLKFVDPSGEVYGIIYDEDQRQITIKANYYVFKSGSEVILDAIDFWNKQSQSINGYKLKIELSIIVVDDLNDESDFLLESTRQNTLSSKMKNDKIGNSIIFMENLPQDREDGEVNGSTVANVIALNANANKWTVAHEIGHSLLLRHTSYGTIMNPGASYIDRDLDNNPMLLIRNNVVDNLIRNQFIEMFKKLKNRKRK